MASILKLGARLDMIVDLCDSCKKVADIGCDHGYITCELILQNKANMVISADISAQSLQKAIMLAEKLNISDFVSFRESDGFQNITKYDKVNQAVIAGMGGKEIIKILEGKPRRLHKFVLGPQSDVLELRTYLAEHGYKIVVDIMVFEKGKYYNIIKVRRGSTKFKNYLDYYFGKTNLTDNNKVFMKYLQEEKEKIEEFKQKTNGELTKKLRDRENLLNKAVAEVKRNSKK